MIIYFILVDIYFYWESIKKFIGLLIYLCD